MVTKSLVPTLPPASEQPVVEIVPPLLLLEVLAPPLLELLLTPPLELLLVAPPLELPLSPPSSPGGVTVPPPPPLLLLHAAAAASPASVTIENNPACELKTRFMMRFSDAKDSSPRDLPGAPQATNARRLVP